MTLTIQKQEDEQRQLNMTIEVEEERIQKAMRQYAKKLARDINVQGFRRGKAPYRVIAKRVGEEYIRYQVVEEMLNDILSEALELENVNPYAQPVLDNLELDPVKLELTIPLEPMVTLGDYRAIRRELETPEITEEAVDEALERVREAHQKVESVDRPSEMGDLVKVTGVGALVPLEAEEDWEVDHSAENQLFHDHDGTEFTLEEGRYFEGTDFIKNLVGVSANDEITFTITFPEDYEEADFAGREAQFKLEVLDVQSREVPEMNDELAQEEGDYETVADLREAKRQELFEAAENRIKNEFLDGMIETLHADATIVYPPGAVDQELEGRVSNLKNQVKNYGWEWEDYLGMQNETEESIQEQWREGVTKDLERSLVLQQFIRDEKLKIKDTQLEEALDERMARFGELDEEMKKSLRQMLLGPEGIQSLANDLMMDKIYERLLAIIKGEAPDLDALEEAEEAAEDEITEDVVETTAVAGESEADEALELEDDESTELVIEMTEEPEAAEEEDEAEA